MGTLTAIAWCDHTFNPWLGCEKVSPGCDHCYAEALMKRTGSPELWRGERRRTVPETWRLPVRWNAAAAKAGIRKKVFCASLADVFDNQIDETWRADLWALIAATPALDWLLLTKRPQNIFGMLPATWKNDFRHVWLGTTVENQAEADRRIPCLLSVPAAKYFLSCEPLLGPVDLDRLHGFMIHPEGGREDWWASCLSGRQFNIFAERMICVPKVDWVIAGGESGPGARPMHPDWARSLRDQCASAGVPFFFKQWGEWAPCPRVEHASGYARSVRSGDVFITRDGVSRIVGPDLGSDLEAEGTPMAKLGKKAAGALLDGVAHTAFPAEKP